MATATLVAVSPPRSPAIQVQQQDDPTTRNTETSPATRPQIRPKRFNLDLEQNPFEMSFSRSSASLSNNRGQRSNSPHHHTTSEPTPSSPSNATSRNSNTSSNNNASKDPSNDSAQDGNTQGEQSGSKTSPKPTLPPLSAIAEGTEESAFPWGFNASDLTSSLRAGPLSPAMLAGPQRPGAPGYSDFASTFRTGLTPGAGRTGLTPLVGGPASFPPPSPNTAAFLANFTNPSGNTPAALKNLTGGATITPNTLSALAGVAFSAAANAESSNPTAANSDPRNPHQPTGTADSQPNHMTISQFSQNPQAFNGSNANGAPPQGYLGATQNAANAAANGLFLLSQAHQELAKREEEQQQQLAAAAAAATTRGGRRASNVEVDQAPQAGNKRKSSTTEAPRPSGGKRARASTTQATAAAPTTRSGGRRKKADKEVSPVEEDAEFEDDDDLDLEMDPAPPTGANKSKKPETEEEKRKNFLERNRQAALKCRQRKKLWLTQLQQKVEYLTVENERLQGTIVSLRDEVTRLSAVVVAHRDCGLGGVILGVPNGAGMGAGQQPPVSVAVNMPQAGGPQAGAAGGGGRGFGY